jgi:hypothetical protein
MLGVIPAILAALSAQMPLQRDYGNGIARWTQFHARPSWIGGEDVRYLADRGTQSGDASGLRIWVTYDWHGSLRSNTQVELWEIDCLRNESRVVEALSLVPGALSHYVGDPRTPARPIASGSAEAVLAALVCSQFRP